MPEEMVAMWEELVLHVHQRHAYQCMQTCDWLTTCSTHIRSHTHMAHITAPKVERVSKAYNSVNIRQGNTGVWWLWGEHLT